MREYEEPIVEILQFLILCKLLQTIICRTKTIQR